MNNKSIMKKAVTISLFAAMTLSLTACSGNNTSDTPSSAVSSASSGAGNSTPVSSASENSAPVNSTVSSAGVVSSADNASSAPNVTSIPEDTPYTLGGELTPAMIARSRYNEGNKVRLAKVIKKLQANEEVTVAYIGGSITQGYSAGDDLCYAKLTTNWLQEKFPNAKINYVNAGIGATGSYLGVYRVEKDVLANNPDLVFVEFSVNDNGDSDNITEINKNTYAGLIRKIWGHSTNPAVVTIAMTQEDGTSFQEHHGEVVKAFDIPMISYKNVILNVIEKGYITWKDISDDNIHPNVAGHAVLSNLITNYLQSVIDDVDNISGNESDLSSSELGAKFQKIKFLTSGEIEPTKMGCFQLNKSLFGGFQNPWFVRNKEGKFTEDDAIEFEFEGKNVDLMYCKLTKGGTKADIYIDGELVKTVDPVFENGWGNYIDMEEIATGLSDGKHTLKVLPQSQEGLACFYVSGIAVS